MWFIIIGSAVSILHLMVMCTLEKPLDWSLHLYLARLVVLTFDEELACDCVMYALTRDLL